MPVFIANFINLIVIFQQPSNEILEDIGAITQLRPEVICSHGLLSPKQHLLRTLGVGITFKWPISPQQVLYPANLRRIVPTEPVSWKYPHRVTSMELFPTRQNPHKGHIRGTISTKLSSQAHSQQTYILQQFGLPNRQKLVLSPESSSQRSHFFNISSMVEYLFSQVYPRLHPQ